MRKDETTQLSTGSLGDIAEVVMGQSPVGSSYNRIRNGVPLINGPTEFTRRHPVAQQWTTAPVRFCRPGDILICVRGSSTGRMNIADAEYCIGRGVAAVRARGKNDQSFVYYALCAVVDQLLKLQTGSTFPSIDSRVIKGGNIRVPSQFEQHAIGRALENADERITTLERLIAKKKAIKQGMIQQLLTGKTRLPGFTKPWARTTLGEIGEALIGLTYEPRSVSRSGTLVLRSSNIQHGRLAFDDNVYVNCSIPDRIRVRDQDVLICVRNGSRRLIGKSVMLDRRVVGQTFGAFMAVFRSDANAYLRYFFQSDDFKGQVDGHLGATINQITNASLKGFTVALPSTQEQTAIAAVLNDVELELAALGARLAKAKVVKQGMAQGLLTDRSRLLADEVAA